MALDDAAHGGDFVGVEDGAEVRAVAFHDRRQRGGHAHVFVAENDARLETLLAAPSACSAAIAGLRESHVLLVVPDVFVLAAVDAELFPELELELADFLLVVTADVDQQDFGHAE